MGLLKTKRDGKLVAYRLDKPAVIVGSGDTCNIRTVGFCSAISEVTNILAWLT